MTQVTLETLRADFEAEIDVVLFEILIAGIWNAETLDRFTASLEVARRTPKVLQNRKAIARLGGFFVLPPSLIQAARILEIAASYDDEQEGLRAAMLFKLSDGEIDPRKGVA